MLQRRRAIIRNRLLASVAFSALLGGTALAQPAPDFTWTGLYVGGNVGYIRGTNHLDTVDAGFNITGSAHGSGVLGGAQLGYNWQLGPVVLGIEGDLDYARTTATGNAGVSLSGVGFQSRIDALGTVRGRFGYAFAPIPLLVYGTAGVAYGDVKNSINLPDFGGMVSTRDWRTGWTAGGGIEYAFARNWTVRAEGLYVDLGSQTVTTNPTNYRFGFRDTAIIGRTDISFKF